MTHRRVRVPDGGHRVPGSWPARQDVAPQARDPRAAGHRLV